MPTYSLILPNYPGNFGTSFDIPLFHDPNLPIANLAIRNSLLSTNTYPLVLDQAIVAAERYLYISPSAVNPVQFVTEWINTLRWEVSNFWAVDIANRAIDTSQLHQITHEHRLRSGEILGYGISILFLESRLNIGRQNFYFYHHNLARPDFIVNFSQNHYSAAAINGVSYGIETRWRKAQANLHQKDVADLNAKKTSPASAHLNGVLALYCFYGSGTHQTNGQRHTRILLADPEVGSGEMSESEIAEVVIHHYLGVMSRIGLNRYHDFLLTAATTLQDNLTQNHFDFGNNDELLPNEIVRTIRQEHYRGRWYSPPIVRLGQLGQASQFSFVFHGVNEKVLELIRMEEWQKLAKYIDPLAFGFADNFGFFEEGFIITSDGVARYDIDAEQDSEDLWTIKKAKH